MKRPSDRFVCPECGEVRITHRGAQFAACPNGHGRLVPRFTQQEARAALLAAVPRARRVGKNLFRIRGRAGLFVYRDGNGRRAARPGTRTQPNEIIARHVTPKRQLIRVFTRKYRSDEGGNDDPS